MSPVAGVIGWPIAQSRSPLIHGYWLKTLGLPGRYERAAVAPEEFSNFIHSLAERGWRGANVTVPHKEAARRLVDDLDGAARAVGAVNTLWFDDGRLIGANTDVEGFLSNLDEGAPGWSERTGTALILGAGGASRAVLHGLAERGVAEIFVANRTVERAEELARDFGRRVRPLAWDQAPAALAAADLVTNATSLGMAGKGDLGLDLRPLKPEAIVTDLVYVPLETPLLRAARERGARVVDGLGMLLHQAVPGFERWFGKRPTVTAELRRLVVDDIEA